MAVFEIRQGSSPVILAFPHTGTEVPAAIEKRLNDNGRKLADTDWHIHQLYADLLPEATTVRATFHRYVIDANRDSSNLRSAQVFNKMAKGEVKARAEFIRASSLEDIGQYKY